MQNDDFNIDDPIEFFELSGDFTAKDLKRAYTRKIKKYKPEKFPEEFKQIREAYEELEREMAYGNFADLSITEEKPVEQVDGDNNEEYKDIVDNSEHIQR